jgi:hypothetical protein
MSLKQRLEEAAKALTIVEAIFYGGLVLFFIIVLLGRAIYLASK